MYLLIGKRVEIVTVTNEEQDGYTFIEERKHYKRYRKSGYPDLLVFKVDNMEELKEFLLKRTDQKNLKARYEAENPTTIKQKLKSFLNYFY